MNYFQYRKKTETRISELPKSLKTRVEAIYGLIKNLEFIGKGVFKRAYILNRDNVLFIELEGRDLSNTFNFRNCAERLLTFYKLVKELGIQDISPRLLHGDYHVKNSWRTTSQYTSGLFASLTASCILIRQATHDI